MSDASGSPRQLLERGGGNNPPPQQQQPRWRGAEEERGAAAATEECTVACEWEVGVQENYIKCTNRDPILIRAGCRSRVKLPSLGEMLRHHLPGYSFTSYSPESGSTRIVFLVFGCERNPCSLETIVLTNSQEDLQYIFWLPFKPETDDGQYEVIPGAMKIYLCPVQLFLVPYIALQCHRDRGDCVTLARGESEVLGRGERESTLLMSGPTQRDLHTDAPFLAVERTPCAERSAAILKTLPKTPMRVSSVRLGRSVTRVLLDEEAEPGEHAFVGLRMTDEACLVFSRNPSLGQPFSRGRVFAPLVYDGEDLEVGAGARATVIYTNTYSAACPLLTCLIVSHKRAARQLRVGECEWRPNSPATLVLTNVSREPLLLRRGAVIAACLFLLVPRFDFLTFPSSLRRRIPGLLWLPGRIPVVQKRLPKIRKTCFYSNLGSRFEH